MRISKVTTVGEMPPEWDMLATSTFQTRAFLAHCERWNPCNQRYYLFYDNEILVGGTIVYSLKIDLLTFLRIRSPFTMHIAGVPCSVSCSGIIGDTCYHSIMIEMLTVHEGGFLLFLNADSAASFGGMAAGKTWPTVVLRHDFPDWPAYCGSLRHEYRRRLRKIETFMHQLTINNCPLDRFEDTHYALYVNVFNKSDGKLEKLSKEFFCTLPNNFQLTTFLKEETLLGWTIGISFRGTYSFFLGGQNYAFEPKMVYLSKLLHIVKTGIILKDKTIDLGQSAEIPKLRFGGELTERFLGAHHANALLGALLKASKGVLTYNKRFKPANVFNRVNA